MLKGVVFDMDGVLIDSHPAHKQAWRRLLESAGRQVTDAELAYVTDGHTRADILRHYLGELSDDQVREYGALKERLVEDVEHSIRPVAGVVELLSALTALGFPVAVATSASRDRATQTLERLQLASWFQVVVTASDVLRGKPNPALFQVAACRLGIDPKFAIAFEDAVSGVIAARAAGMTCVGVGPSSRRSELLTAGASIVVPDLSNLSGAKLEAIMSCRTSLLANA